MQFSISRSISPGFSAISPHQNANPHQAKLPLLKPTRKLNYISSECSQFHLHEKYSKIFSRKNESSSNVTPINKSYGRKVMPLIRTNSQLGGDKFAESPLEKVLDFREAVAQFLKEHIIRNCIVAVVGMTAKTWLDNAHQVTLPKWSILLRALAAIIAILCRDGYTGGINQIFDVEIDKINKPFLPIASGRLSLQSAWQLVISFIAISILIAGVGLNSVWFVAFLVFGYLAGSAYSIPPIRLKTSTIGAILTCGIMRGGGFTLTIAAAARATLGLKFEFSLQVILLTIFGTMTFLALGVLKDLPDLEGDIKNNIPTLASIIGARKAAFIGHGILIHAYVGAILAAIFMPKVFRASVMIPAHAIVGLCVLYRAWKLEKSNYSKEESAAFCQFVFKIFDLEFLILPFI